MIIFSKIITKDHNSCKNVNQIENKSKWSSGTQQLIKKQILFQKEMCLEKSIFCNNPDHV